MIFNWFNKKGPTDPEEFRKLFVACARKLHPEKVFETPPSEFDLVIVGQTQLGLGNAFARFELTDRSKRTLALIVSEHLSILDSQPDEAVLSFERAQDMLRPQLMTLDRTEGMPLAYLPFGQTLAVAVVVDLPTMMKYVNHDQLMEWGKNLPELLEIAVANLDEASRGIEMNYQSNPAANLKMVMVNVMDSYDAARITSRKFRDHIASRIGSPYYIGLSNRDFLICWNVEAISEMTQSILRNIRNDYAEQPYSLSPHVFETDFGGEIVELVNGV